MLPRIEPLPLRRQAEPFADPDWIFELKHDGYRGMVYLQDDECRIVGRGGADFSRFDVLRRRLATDILATDAIVDGEVVCLDDSGRSLFHPLMRHQGDPCFIAFDLPWLDGEDLRDRPLLERKRLLREVIPKRSGCVLYLEHIEGNGTGLFDLVCKQDLEGMIAKPAASPYRERRRPWWVKVKNPAYSQARGRREMFEGFRRR